MLEPTSVPPPVTAARSWRCSRASTRSADLRLLEANLALLRLAILDVISIWELAEQTPPWRLPPSTWQRDYRDRAMLSIIPSDDFARGIRIGKQPPLETRSRHPSG